MKHLMYFLIFISFLIPNTGYAQNSDSVSNFLSSEEYLNYKYQVTLYITGGRKGVEPQTGAVELDSFSMFASIVDSDQISFCLEETEALPPLPIFDCFEGKMKGVTFNGKLRQKPGFAIELTYDAVNHKFEGQILKDNNVAKAFRIIALPIKK